MQGRVEKNGEVAYFSYASSEELAKYKRVYVWDLDNTYLATRLGAIRGFLHTVFEGASKKKNIPGTNSLCLGLKSHWSKSMGEAPFPLFFITASPPELEKVIVRKLQLDGVFPKGLFCKDFWFCVRKMDFKSLTHQIGYKLQALLGLRLLLGEDVRQILWGDDSESDVISYSLYTDICARRMEGKNLIKTLEGLGLFSNQIDNILQIQDRIPQNDPVEKIYINLVDDTDIDYYLKFGRRCLPTYNSFQAALDLFQGDFISGDHVVMVAKDMLVNFGFTRDEFESSLDDLICRHVLGVDALEKILPKLQENGLVHSKFEPPFQPQKIKEGMGGGHAELEGNVEPWVPIHINYLSSL